MRREVIFPLWRGGPPKGRGMNLVGACRRVARRTFGIERLRPEQETAHAALLGHGCKAAPQVLPDLPRFHAHRPIASGQGSVWLVGRRPPGLRAAGPRENEKPSASSPPVLTEPALNSRIISRQASAAVGTKLRSCASAGISACRPAPRRGLFAPLGRDEPPVMMADA